MDNCESNYRCFLEGDESAFDEILKAYRYSLFFICRYIHDTAAEDIAIDAFMELMVHRNRYNFKTSLKTYLYVTDRSRALDYNNTKDKWYCENNFWKAASLPNTFALRVPEASEVIKPSLFLCFMRFAWLSILPVPYSNDYK